ncbi:hypothetical protein HJG60_011109 [Phyllostomus discolor]|uniref:Uncharacterized protein n=1 Tax=Phyllostomus discolor TaxID=89673 RepID=A0A834A737_9CHIR|nr:hypothetical protein HJG60_011109 [Phyllostomus discolor]
MTAALCSSERALCLPLVPDTRGESALAAGPSCSCAPALPGRLDAWTPARSRRRPVCFCRRCPRPLLAGLPFTRRQFWSPGLAGGRAHSRCGAHPKAARSFKWLWGANEAPESILGSSLAFWCHREGWFRPESSSPGLCLRAEWWEQATLGPVARSMVAHFRRCAILAPGLLGSSCSQLPGENSRAQKINVLNQVTQK